MKRCESADSREPLTRTVHGPILMDRGIRGAVFGGGHLDFFCDEIISNMRNDNAHQTIVFT